MTRRPPPLMRLLAGGLSVALVTLTCLPPQLSQADAAEQRIRFFHPDHLGSTNVVTDETGQVVEVIEYKPFGEVYKITGPDRVPHTFTGQRLDDSTGLYFYNARYYDPQLGRFVSPDAIVQDLTDPQAFNSYSYVRNNPTNLVDPSGHIFQFLIAAIFAIAKVAAVVSIGAGITSLIASATGHERTAQRFANVSQIAAYISTPATFAEGWAWSVTASYLLASAAQKAATPEDPVATAFAGPSFTAASSASGLQRTFGAIVSASLTEVATAILFGGVGVAAQTAKRTGQLGLRKLAARYGPTLGEDTIPAGQRLMVKPGAIDAPLDYTTPGETFIRVSDNPTGLKFSFKSPGGAQAKTYAFPEEQFRKFNNNPYLMKYAGDLPGGPPTIYGRFTPPPGTPIKRGTVPGGQFGGAGGAQEVYFPDEF